MTNVHQKFAERASRIPFLGLGLSVDVYSPDVLDLGRELQQQRLSIAYLEVFHAVPEALQLVRTHFSGIPMAYHVEGLWFTQPDWEVRYPYQERLDSAVRDSRILQAQWINQECATKEIAGYAFGTYVPPLLTNASAEVTAYHAWKAQQHFDQSDGRVPPQSPLLLLEVPPLSYFSMGNISYAEYFAILIEKAPCGIVLDLGHIWTVYRYTVAGKQKWESFLIDFFEQFPLERVIQIHVAGLANHPHFLSPVSAEQHEHFPSWIDAHEAPIPQVLFDMLERVLRDPRLMHLKAVALEVDNKPLPLICQEIHLARKLVEPHFSAQNRAFGLAAVPLADTAVCSPSHVPAISLLEQLNRQYENYVDCLSGKEKFTTNRWLQGRENVETLHWYIEEYLPYEILTWGGNVSELFPRTCQLLQEHDISLDLFVEFWFSRPCVPAAVYDFFLLKLSRFADFLHHHLPSASSTVRHEAEVLARSYVMACQRVT